MYINSLSVVMLDFNPRRDAPSSVRRSLRADACQKINFCHRHFPTRVSRGSPEPRTRLAILDRPLTAPSPVTRTVSERIGSWRSFVSQPEGLSGASRPVAGVTWLWWWSPRTIPIWFSGVSRTSPGPSRLSGRQRRSRPCLR